MHRLATRLALVLVVLAPGVMATNAETPSSSLDGLWVADDDRDREAESTLASALPDTSRSFTLNVRALENVLSRAPSKLAFEAGPGDAVMSLPMPDGSFSRFRIAEWSVMAPELAARYPQIRTFIGRGIDDPAATVRFDWTQRGFHAQVLSTGGTVNIDPLVKGNTSVYTSYRLKDYRPTEVPFGCETEESNHESSEFAADSPGGAPAAPEATGGDTVILRTYEIAIAAGYPYTLLVSDPNPPNKADALAAIVTALVRINGIYETEVAIHLELVANNDEVVFETAGEDLFEGGGVCALAGQAHDIINSIIGRKNFDVGHSFHVGPSGGCATNRSACWNGGKGQGASRHTAPQSDPFFVSYVSHELGHQFGGRHTFNGENCYWLAYNGDSAYEPGSGSTIMSYAGICGDDDLQDESDPYFHSRSYEGIRGFADSYAKKCSDATDTGNYPPTVDAGPVYSVPLQTPFVLTATGSDPDGGNVNYSWEERDLGPTAPLDAEDDGEIPLFRVFPPVPDPSRTFPRLSVILDHANVDPDYHEKLPTEERTMEMIVVARDSQAPGGGVATDTTQVIFADSLPFAVTSPMGGEIWSATQLVEWNVGETNQTPISTATVNILLSTDNGATFPTVLAANTPNDGIESVTIPETPSSAARIKVEAVGNIFFDISESFETRMTPCPATNPCPSPQCGPSAFVASDDTGLNACDLGSGQTFDCGAQTVHIVTYDCGFSACCFEFPSCACGGCPAGRTYLVCE